MSASINDKITDTFNGSNPTATTVSGTRAIAGSTLTCASLSGWPTTTAVHFVTYQKDSTGAKVAGTQVDWKGIVSGSTVTNLTRQGGTADGGNVIGDIVEMMPTFKWAQDLATGLELEHHNDGTHAAISTTSITNAGNTLTTGNETVSGNLAVTGTSAFTGAVTLPSSTITNANLSTTAGEVGAAWASWSPTWANFTTTNLTVDAKYKQVGKTVFFRLHAVGGASSASGTAPTFTLPVTSVATPGTAMPIATGNYISKNAWLSWASTTTAALRAWDANNDLQTVTNTLPATFGNGSVMDFQGSYEAA